MLEWGAELKRLFSGYVDRKEACGVLDYDDLLLYWHGLLEDPAAGPIVRGQFDCVLVDEYQDTNRLAGRDRLPAFAAGQGGDGRGRRRAIDLFLPRGDGPQYTRPAQALSRHENHQLEQNYRSTQPILEATNGVIALATERYAKNLWSVARRGNGRCRSPATTRSNRRTS